MTRRQAIIAAAASLAYLHGKTVVGAQAQQYGVPSGSIILTLDGIPSVGIRLNGRLVSWTPAQLMAELSPK